MVADVIVETPDTTTLVLFTGNDRLEYLAGHFLTIDPHQFESLERFTSFLEDLKGQARAAARVLDELGAARALSGGDGEGGALRFGRDPSTRRCCRRCSSSARSRGMRLVVIGFTGPYTLAPDVASRTDHIVHVCAGSGSVPNFSMLKFALANHPTLRHTFVYSNKTWDDVIFRDELGRLAASASRPLEDPAHADTRR